jgi:hypothetical protein
MPRPRLVVSRRVSGLLTCTICSAVALAFLLTAPAAMSQGTGQDTTAPDNGNPFSRWFRAPVAAPATAAPVAAQPTQSIRKPRVAKVRKRTKPVAAQPAPADEKPAPPAQEHAATSDWPNAETNLGAAMIVPLTIKTVREMAEPEPEAPLVFENELSDIDLAAGPALAEARLSAPQAMTDGSGATDNETAEQSGIIAMGETMKAMMQSAWLEPLLLVLAGLLASFTAVRAFA